MRVKDIATPQRIRKQNIFHIILELLIKTFFDRKIKRFFARGDGFWRSDDGGATWRQLSAGLEDRLLVSIAISRAGSIYIAASNGDVWISTNGGEQWQSVRRDLAASNAISIALTAEDERLLLSTDSEGSFLLHQGFMPIGGDK